MLIDKTSSYELSRTPETWANGQVIYMTPAGLDWCRETAPTYMRTHEEVSAWAQSEARRHMPQSIGSLIDAFRVEWF